MRAGSRRLAIAAFLDEHPDLLEQIERVQELMNKLRLIHGASIAPVPKESTSIKVIARVLEE